MGAENKNSPSWRIEGRQLGPWRQTEEILERGTKCREGREEHSPTQHKNQEMTAWLSKSANVWQQAAERNASETKCSLEEAPFIEHRWKDVHCRTWAKRSGRSFMLNKWHPEAGLRLFSVPEAAPTSPGRRLCGHMSRNHRLAGQPCVWAPRTPSHLERAP